MISSRDVPRTAAPQLSRINRAYILVGVAEASMVPFLPILLLERGFDAALIGVVMSAAGLVSFIAGPIWAQLADRGWRPERTLVIACAGAAAVVLALAVPGGPLLLAVATVLLWIVRSPLAALLDSIALQRLGSGRTAGYARIRMRMSAGWAASAIVAGAVLQIGGYRMIPFLYAPLMAVFTVWAWRNVVRGAPALQPQISRRSGQGDLRGAIAALSGFLASVFLLGIAFGATSNYITLQINFLGGGALLIGAAAAFQALTEVPTMAYMHVLTRRVGTRRLFAAGCAIYLAVFLAWAFVSSPVLVALLRLVVGVGFAFIAVGAVLISDELIAPRQRATAQALVKGTMFGLAPVAGTLGGGFVYSAFGPTSLFIGAAVLAGAAAVVGLTAVSRLRASTSLPEVEPAPAPALASTAVGADSSPGA